MPPSSDKELSPAYLWSRCKPSWKFVFLCKVSQVILYYSWLGHKTWPL